MPVVAPEGSWRAVSLPGDAIQSDDAFQFLAGFDEIDTAPPPPTVRRKRKSGNVAAVDAAEDGAATSRRKRIRGKQRTRKAKAKKVVTVASSGALDSVVDDEEKEEEDGEESDMMEWTSACVPSEVVTALRRLHFDTPTEIQRLVLPAAIRDRLDILGAAETGSGKTLAFGIPIVAGLLAAAADDKPIDGRLGALVVLPTRELAMQVHDHIAAILTHTPFRIAVVVGGLSVQRQERLLKRRPEILVATPGRLWAHMQEASPDDYLGDWSGLRFLVIDETDRMVERGHFDELALILERVAERSAEVEGGGVKRQTFVFSATLTYVHPAPRRLTAETRQLTPKEKIDSLVSMAGLRQKHKVIDITRSFATAQGLTETRLNCDNLVEKDTYLYYFLSRYEGRTLVFVNSVDAAKRLHGLLSKLDYQPFLLHARMHQKQRLKNLERFAAQPASVLLATDVAARGLDIRGINHIVHYQVPKTAELYVHRSGRTARASDEGLSLMLVDAIDAHYYKRICTNLNRERDLPVFPIDRPALLRQLKERVRVAGQLDAVELRQRRGAARRGWFQRRADDAEIDVDADPHLSADVRETAEEGDELRRRSRQLGARLKARMGEATRRERAATTRYPTAALVQRADAEAADDADALAAAKHGEQAAIARPNVPAAVVKAVRASLRKTKQKKRQHGRRKR